MHECKNNYQIVSVSQEKIEQGNDGTGNQNSSIQLCRDLDLNGEKVT